MWQWQDNSAFDLITVARDTPVAEGLALLRSKMSGLPDCNCLVMAMTRVEGGFLNPMVQNYSAKKIKFSEDYCRAAAHYHQVKSLDDFILSDGGDAKKGDMNKLFRSGQPK
jgi:hypothetical protein